MLNGTCMRVWCVQCSSLRRLAPTLGPLATPPSCSDTLEKRLGSGLGLLVCACPAADAAGRVREEGGRVASEDRPFTACLECAFGHPCSVIGPRPAGLAR